MNSDDELAQRGRAIFERLREGSETADVAESPSEDRPEGEVEHNPEGGVGLSIPGPETVPAEAEQSPDAETEPAEDPVEAPADVTTPSTPPGVGEFDHVSSGTVHAHHTAAAPVDLAANDAGEGVAGELVTDPERDDEAAGTLGESDDPGDEPEAGPPVAVVEADAADPALARRGEATGPLDPGEVPSGGAIEGSETDLSGPLAVVGEADAVLSSADSMAAPVVDDYEVPQLVAEEPASFARPLPRILAIANQKGGVGKTTTAVNLSAALAELGYRVLVIDLDPQGNATTGLGVNPRNLESSVYDVLMHDVPLEDCIEPTSLRNLFVVPATIDLAGAEIELVPSFSRELKLRKALEGVIDDFDYVLIDCPPSLGLITVNGLAAATEVVVPIQCEYYALEGLGQLLRNVNLVQGSLNPTLEVSAIILTMYDARTKLADQVAGEVRTHFGTKVCRNIVPRTVRLSEAPSFGQPIIVFDPSSRGAIAYRELAKEVSGGAPQRVG